MACYVVLVWQARTPGIVVKGILAELSAQSIGQGKRLGKTNATRVKIDVVPFSHRRNGMDIRGQPLSEAKFARGAQLR